MFLHLSVILCKGDVCIPACIGQRMCIPACNGHRVCVSQHAMGQGYVCLGVSAQRSVCLGVSGQGGGQPRTQRQTPPWTRCRHPPGPRGRHPQTLRKTPPPRWPLKLVVCILLECVLILNERRCMEETFLLGPIVWNKVILCFISPLFIMFLSVYQNPTTPTKASNVYANLNKIIYDVLSSNVFNDQLPFLL